MRFALLLAVFLLISLSGFADEKGSSYLETQLGYSFSLPIQFYQTSDENAKTKDLKGPFSKIGFGHYLSDGVGHFLFFVMENNGDKKSKKPALGPEYLFKIHFGAMEGGSFFWEGGFCWLNRKTPLIEGGSTSYFKISLGLGIFLQLRKHFFFQLGVRASHLSNFGILNKEGENTVSFQSLSGFAGMSYQF